MAGHAAAKAEAERRLAGERRAAALRALQQHQQPFQRPAVRHLVKLYGITLAGYPCARECWSCDRTRDESRPRCTEVKS